MRRSVVALLLLATACASPAERIATRLEQAGLSPRQAKCMGDRLADRLSYAQLDQLGALVKSGDGERLTVGRLVGRMGDADPALVNELVRTGLSCAI